MQAASAGGLHTLALTQEGQMFCFGFGRWGQLGLGVDSLAGVHTPNAGLRFAAALCFFAFSVVTAANTPPLPSGHGGACR